MRTKGPWQFWDRENPSHALITDEQGSAGIATPILRIHSPTGECPEEMRANARLIAAAPDLLEACEATMVWFETLAAGQPMADMLEKVKAAIRKATT